MINIPRHDSQRDLKTVITIPAESDIVGEVNAVVAAFSNLEPSSDTVDVPQACLLPPPSAACYDDRQLHPLPAFQYIKYSNHSYQLFSWERGGGDIAKGSMAAIQLHPGRYGGLVAPEKTC